MNGASRCQVSSVRCWVLGVWCQASVVRCQVADVMSQATGVRCQSIFQQNSQTSHFREDDSDWKPVHQFVPIKVYPQPNTNS